MFCFLMAASMNVLFFCTCLMYVGKNLRIKNLEDRVVLWCLVSQGPTHLSVDSVFLFASPAVSFISATRSLSRSAGVVFPLHCVCGLHHAAVLHAGRHHRQRPDLCLSHPRVERLALPDSRTHGTSGVAGRSVSFLTKRAHIPQRFI